MALSLSPQQLPDQRILTLNIDDIIAVTDFLPDAGKPQLEEYFSPSKRKQFEKDYTHYLNSSLLNVRHGELDLELYLVLVLSFQFVAPLLEINVEEEFQQFLKILEKRYDMEDPDVNLHFTSDEYDEGMLGEEEALETFREELDESYEGRREIKESVQRRLKRDATDSIMEWQRKKGIKELAEAFGRSIVIPAFFDFSDKKLAGFYRRATEGISYEVAVPDFHETENT
jgi:hypothetical protein